MKKLTALHIALLMVWIPAVGQVADSSAVDTTRSQISASDSLTASPNDTTIQKKEEPESGQVTPWSEMGSAGSIQITNDSLMRWQIWPNWGDFQAYRRDVISFRQGTNGRVDAFHINGYQPLEQQLEMEGLSLNNPVTGLPNYNLVPHRKIGVATELWEGNYYSDIRLRDYYILKPISYLNYDEASGNYRNLEFMVAQNFTERTNVEISYWDRRGGGYYPNSEINGSQVVGRVYHHLNDRYLIRGMYLRNQLSNDEPFGYNVGDPATFPFDEFTSVPNSTSGKSEFTRWDLIGGIYHRSDTASAEDGGLELSIANNEKSLRFTGDTLGWDLRTIGGTLFKKFTWNKLSMRGEVEVLNHVAEDDFVLTERNWTEIKGEGNLVFEFVKGSELYGKAKITNRSDGFSGSDLTLGFNALISRKHRANVSASSFSRMPTMQALYWQSKNYAGNPDLENEEGISAAASLDVSLFPTLTMGVSGRVKSAKNATFLSPDSTFSNSGSFTQLSGTAYARFENHRFEIESSASAQQFDYDDPASTLAGLNHRDQIIWLRNSAFVKGYVFDRAAYLKVGVKTLLSPTFYSSGTYNTELHYWQGNSTYQPLPAFFRMDAELSARVRGIMVVMRWENALDGLGQAGYFEAAGFPMPPRRLIVGIRAQFRN
ncbi:putative porin [Gracilimonas sp. BCB1]|uniref:putative porin n=1 Tax=Gracilimonas sp. BCB1 TaxID=3152362 RepID=UPI0032D8FECE